MSEVPYSVASDEGVAIAELKNPFQRRSRPAHLQSLFRFAILLV